MKYIKLFSLYICFSCCAKVSFSQDLQEINSGERSFIGKNLEYFIDTTNRLGIRDVINKIYVQNKNDILNLNIVPYNVWMRFSVISKTENELFLEIMTPLLEKLEVYRMIDGSPHLIFEGGFNASFNARPIKIDNWVLNLENTKDSTSTYYIKGRTGFNFQIPIAISSKDKFIESNQLHSIFWGIYIGTMLFALVYNLFIFFSVRERRYFYYIMYVIGTSIFYLALQGFSFMFLWPNMPFLNKHIAVIICLTNIIITLFAMNFLHITKRQKGQYYFAFGIIGSFVLIALLNIIGPYKITTIPAQMMSLAIASFCIYSGFKGLKTGIHTARYFVIAWTLFSLFCILFILTINNVVSSNFFTTHCIFIGHMTEVLLLSFALADRINALKRENARFQQEILKTQLEIQEQTFKTISQEIHDNIGQILAVAKLNLNSINLSQNEGTIMKIDCATDLLTKAIRDLRDLSKTLNTDIISVSGLTGAVEAELLLLQKTGAINTKFRVDGIPKKLDPQKELIIFRVIQESINNIIKHSQATEVRTTITYTEDKLELVVVDNGKGFNFQRNNSSGSGMRNIESRCKLIQAKSDIVTSPGNGTALTIIVPLDSTTKNILTKTTTPA